MWRRRHFRGNTFAYLLALIVFLVSLAILAVGGISYRVSTKALETETRQALLLREARLRAQIESELNRFQSFSQGLSLNRSVMDQLPISSAAKVEDIMRFREIIQALSGLQMSMPPNSVLSVYFKRANMVATHGTRYTGEDFFARYREEDKQVIQERLSHSQPFSLLVDVSAARYGALPAQRVLLMGKGLPYASSYPFGGMIAEVPISYLEAMLQPEEGSLQFVLGEGNQLLMSAVRSEEPAILEEAVALVSSMSLLPGDPFWLDATLAGKPHFVTISVSSLEKWTYVAVIPAEKIFEGVRNISHVTFFVGLGAAILCALISLLALRRLYTPIKSLLDVLALRGTPYQPRQKAGRDLEHIRNIVNTVWTENESMQRLIGGMRELLQQDILNRLMDNNALDDEALAQSGLSEMQGYFQVLLPEISPMDGTVSRYALCARAVESAESLCPPGVQFRCVVRPHDQVALLLYTEDPLEDSAIRPALEALLAILDRRAHAPCALAIGHRMPGVRTLGDSYMQAKETLYWALTRGITGIIHHEEMLQSGQVTNASLLLREGDSREDSLRDLYAHAVNHGDYLVAYLLRHFQETGEEASANEALHDIMQLNSAGERLDFIMQLSKKSGGSARQRLAALLMRFLEEQYSDMNLSLSMMADHFGYTSNYISTIIKEETKIGFLEYLTRIRLEHAAELLRTTENLVSDIAIQTGFGHVNTFIRVFRRYYHSTPAQFRAEKRL